MRLAARSPLHSEPGSASSTNIVIRCATQWEKMAFHKLPLLIHFVAVRFTREFASREMFCETNGEHPVEQECGVL